MDPDKRAFLFGELPTGVDPEDPAHRAMLLTQAHGSEDDEETGRLRVMLAQQILDDDPPEVWQTANRLVADGMDHRTALTQLAVAITPVLLDAVSRGGDLDRESYLARLERLPLPTTEQILSALGDTAQIHGPLDLDELDRLAAERLGVSLEDPVIRELFEHAGDWLTDEGGPLALLAGDVVAHVESVTAGIVLTHRLTEAEQRSGMLDASVDLVGFQRRGGLQRPNGAEIVTTIRDSGALFWIGEEDWLADYPAGALLGVGVDPGGAVRLHALDPELEAADPLVDLVRDVYEEALAEPGLPVDAEDLVLGILVRQPDAFSVPRPPLSDLADRAGLELRGQRFAHDEWVWQNQDQAGQLFRVMDRLDNDKAQVLSVMRALELLEQDVLDVADARAALAEMYDPLVLEVVPDELLGLDDEPERIEALRSLSARLLAASRNRKEQAVAQWLCALADERRGAVLDAESHLRAAVRADPGWPCAEDRLAWYEADRGDAASALARWRSLGAPEDSEDVRSVLPFADVAQPALGRNEPCWCGSGRKFKACHLRRPAVVPLPDRVGWLCRKAVSYLERRGGPPRLDVMEYAEARALDPDIEDSLAEAMDDPLVLDAVLHEGGWFDRFLADRGPLLPDDEALLARAWTLVDRTVYEVIGVDAGASMRVRDLRTGDQLDVRERTASRQASRGQLLCGRAVPDGESHQFVGGLFGVSPGRETHLLDLLDTRDGLDLLKYVAAQNRPPTMVSPEGDPLVECHAVVEVPDADNAAAELGRRYAADGEGFVWLQPLPDGANRQLAGLRLQDRQISVHTMTEPRMDDVLAGLREALPGCSVSVDERQPFQWPAADGAVTAKTSPLQLPPEAAAELADRFERRWCDESVPALGGRTPRQAADDPTRRTELTRLIDSFPSVDLDDGVIGLRPERLRALLGLDAF